MIAKKPQFYLALLVMSVFLFQSCATLMSGTSMGIPVTSNPPGTKVLVDGQDMGQAPTLVKLKKKKSHTIRLEKEGYNPLEIRIEKTGMGAGFNTLTIMTDILAGAFIGLVIGWALGRDAIEKEYVNMWVEVLTDKKTDSDGSAFMLPILGMLLGATIVPFVDSKLGGTSTLTPEELNVTLKEAEGRAQPDVIFIDPERFQRIKWIRVK